jgi:hypothetical protein
METFQSSIVAPTFAGGGAYEVLVAQMQSASTTVTVTLFKDDGSTETLSGNAAVLHAGNLWRWSTQNITTQPVTRTHYVARFADQLLNYTYIDLWLGGEADKINAVDKNVKSIL